MNTMERAARRVATTAGPPQQALQQRVYQNQASRTIVNPLVQAAEVLCLLAFYPLSEITRVGLLALLDRRLRRAYEGRLP